MIPKGVCSKFSRTQTLPFHRCSHCSTETGGIVARSHPFPQLGATMPCVRCILMHFPHQGLSLIQVWFILDPVALLKQHNCIFMSEFRTHLSRDSVLLKSMGFLSLVFKLDNIGGFEMDHTRMCDAPSLGHFVQTPSTVSKETARHTQCKRTKWLFIG